MVARHHRLNVNLSKLWEMVKDREARHAAVHRVAESDTTERLNKKVVYLIGCTLKIIWRL